MSKFRKEARIKYMRLGPTEFIVILVIIVVLFFLFKSRKKD
ncbi:hypothetical protein DGWBC_0858 [Dehalogenimonas sp. WBC-2]|nr:hypothetical protein DGWBC_0858 [Dehalogenimonas sp. WBC-2]